MARIMALPDVVERLARLDIRAVGSRADELGKTIASEIDLWTQVAAANKIRPQ